MQRELRTVTFFNYHILAESLGDVRSLERRQEGFLISTINPHAFYVAEHDPEFKEALEKSDVLLPDGVGVVLANLFINWSFLKRVSGMDIFFFLLRQLNRNEDDKRSRIFFLGSTNENLQLIKNRINQDFPRLQVGYYSPPYKSVFAVDDQAKIISEINAFKPYVVFVGMTAPKQEKWAYQNRGLIHAKILCSIGAVFDFYTGRIKRPSKVWRFLGLEWLIRFMGEPRRLWRRNLISLPYFLMKVFKEALRAKK